MRFNELEDAMFVKEKHTGWVGTLIGGPFEDMNGEICIGMNFMDELGEEDYGEFPLEDLVVLPPKNLDAKTLRSLVRYEILPEDLKIPYGLYENCLYQGDYKVTAEDLLSGIRTMKRESPIEVCRMDDWRRTFWNIEENAGIFYPEKYHKLGEEEIIAYVFMKFEDMILTCLESEESKYLMKDDFKVLEDILICFMEDSDKPISDRRIPLDIMKAIAGQYDSDTIDKENLTTQLLFKKSLDTLSEMEDPDPKALQTKGYCIYCGTNIYPQNWPQARDIFLRYYELTGDPSAANTLGYIFYYGRCTGGVPEYEKAFKYFSIGYAFGYYESAYKLADMFAHGYCVVKNEETAYRLYSRVYEENRKAFLSEDFRCKFADAALRMGNCYYNGIGVERDPKTACVYYLEAEYAIGKRIEQMNYYGDQVVYNGIRKALRKAREEFDEYSDGFDQVYPAVFRLALDGGRRAVLTWEELEDNSLKVTVRSLCLPDEAKAPKMLITFAEGDYCELTDTLEVTIATDSKIYSPEGRIIFNHFSFDPEKMRTLFALDEEETGYIETEVYAFTVPGSDLSETNEEYVTFVSARFHPQGKSYDYLCEIGDVSVGDHVIVCGYDGETEVEVTEVCEQDKNKLMIPLERYKKILRKA